MMRTEWLERCRQLGNDDTDSVGMIIPTLRSLIKLGFADKKFCREKFCREKFCREKFCREKFCLARRKISSPTFDRQNAINWEKTVSYPFCSSFGLSVGLSVLFHYECKILFGAFLAKWWWRSCGDDDADWAARMMRTDWEWWFRMRGNDDTDLMVLFQASLCRRKILPMAAKNFAWPGKKFRLPLLTDKMP